MKSLALSPAEVSLLLCGKSIILPKKPERRKLELVRSPAMLAAVAEFRALPVPVERGSAYRIAKKHKVTISTFYKVLDEKPR